ncbi:MAG: hypothetical protein HQL52_19290 [Magnetococcales bacterium]|nr:hypothetical protein [Magnetococcales bacterium]
MGGIGSGGHNNNGFGTVEDTLQLDINFLRRLGGLNVGARGKVFWDPGKGIVFQMKACDQLVLMYRCRLDQGDWESVEQSIRLSGIPRHLGGQERYFICPGAHCGRRVKKLYLSWKYFACRHCYRLSYRSQRERGIAQIVSRMDKIRVLLGGNRELFPSKPPNMRQDRYDQLIDELIALEIQCDMIEDSVRARWQKCCGMA